MEIERKFTVKKLPANLKDYKFHIIEQAYLNTDPVIRIRREDDSYYLTYKGKGLLAREEYNLPLNKESYEHLLPKADGNIISKTRYLLPIEDTDLTVELDLFNAPFDDLIIAEVEFESEEQANAFSPLDWFDQDVTQDTNYHNSTLSK
ncbi:MAG: CYTH domain-containing protein, partial [Lachnospiraceae bacterium]|nr:CYTH domain-containing protein [Lachnospiraceae bacterium]